MYNRPFPQSGVNHTATNEGGGDADNTWIDGYYQDDIGGGPWAGRTEEETRRNLDFSEIENYGADSGVEGYLAAQPNGP